ncbi:DNA polymerase III subunit psi, partial [Salmonella enterica subsp. enterica serovar Montevideo]|nr:DNA polymerase III subunit psi [Salmonella enterica subsp. enterica serovar Montevideo]
TDAPLQLEGAQVTTPAFNELRANPAARAALWQQICEHEHDFYTRNAKVGKVLTHLGLERIDSDIAEAGDIIAITGLGELNISDT